MNLNELAKIRLAQQQLTAPQFTSAVELVSRMGAMQAQDFPMSKWAVGIRVPNATEQSIEEAINRGELIRTHVLRPTWHLVAAEDVFWMLELTGPRINAATKSRDKELGLTEQVYRKSNALIEKALSDGQHLSRTELVSIFIREGFSVDDNRAAHLLMRAEVEGLIGSGKIENGKPTYALLAGRLVNPKRFTRDEALAELALRYFRSHGPATLPDFTWWSGLKVGDARLALEQLKSQLHFEVVEGETYWFDANAFSPDVAKDSLHLLPAYDEFIISYKNRAASLVSEHHKKAISSNGFFRPVIVYDGKVIGTWKKTVKRNEIKLETDYFSPVTRAVKQKVETAFERYVRFSKDSRLSGKHSS